MKERLKALLLALALFVTLGACKENKKDENNSSASATTDSISNKPVITQTSVVPSYAVEDVPVVNDAPTSSDNLHFLTSEKGYALDSAYIQDELAKRDSGKPFKFPYVSGVYQISSLFELTGPYFKQIEKDGQKCLVYADNEENILVSGYDYLGMPFYLFGYDAKNGGSDPDSPYSGWVLPVYSHVDDNSPGWNAGIYYTDIIPGYTYSLYDFEDFRLLLEDCQIDYYYSGNLWGETGPIFAEYFKALDPAYGGCDEENTASGYAVEVIKYGTKYLVDANDFTQVYYQDYSGKDTYDTTFYFKNVYQEDSDTHKEGSELKPFYSEDLVRERKK